MKNLLLMVLLAVELMYGVAVSMQSSDQDFCIVFSPQKSYKVLYALNTCEPQSSFIVFHQLTDGIMYSFKFDQRYVKEVRFSDSESMIVVDFLDGSSINFYPDFVRLDVHFFIDVDKSVKAGSLMEWPNKK